MTDNETKKALECCKNDDCDNCPNGFGNCYANLAGYALDLINRYEEKIEGLHTAFENSQTATKKWHREAELNAGEIIKLQAEVERLEKHTEMYNEVKAEAYEEFAEKLKELLGVTKFSLIDNLVKELKG